jgi:hypothetical protein
MLPVSAVPTTSEEVNRKLGEDAERFAGAQGVLAMMLLLEATYPSANAERAGQVFADQMMKDPLPDYIKLVDVYQCWGGAGIRAFAFYDMEKGHEQESVDYITRNAMELTKQIDDYVVTFSSIVYPMVEAYKLIGMQAPATEKAMV